LTAWVDSEGKINFRDDIYSRDMVLAQTLNQKPRAP
jgi:murein L,D-transpeptidase YcbB/YkuD